jgi:hypothetical protein
MRSHPRATPSLIVLAALCGTITSCLSVSAADTPGAGDAQTPASTATEPGLPVTTIDGVTMLVPEDWYSAQVELERLQALIFMRLDPDDLAEFDDPDLALPLDYAAGALIITPLPEDSDAQTLSEAMLSAIPDLTGDDLDAMLLALDQAGLIDYTAVASVQLLRAGADTLAGLPALMMDGMVTFVDELPPELRAQVWLTWTEASFVAYYALAAEQAWPDAEAGGGAARV